MRLAALIQWLSDNLYYKSGPHLLSLSHLLVDSACLNVF